jgi:hypothetical protein
MKKTIKLLTMVLVIAMVMVSCKKDADTTNAAANTANAAANTFSLNNRVLAAFVLDGNTLPNIALPASFNKFRKLLTYDTIATANKPVVYNVGDVITILGYVKGDDNAISRRNINIRFFQPSPSTFNRPTDLYPTQRAEDSIRNYAPNTAAGATILDQLATLNISNTATTPFTISTASTEVVNGVNYTTFLIKVDYTIPATLSGKLVSINFNINNSLRNDIGNVNWIYAFRVR